jgi:hypothetical protein
VARFRASLSVYSDHLSLSEIVARLGPATRGHDRADSRPGGRSAWGQTFWSWESELGDSPPSLDQLVANVVSFVERNTEVLEALDSGITGKRIFCGVFVNEDPSSGAPGFALNAELLKRIAKLDIDLDVDIV